MSNPATVYNGNYSWGVGASAVISLLELRSKRRYLMAGQQGKSILDEELTEVEYRMYELLRRTNERNIGDGALGQNSFKIIQSSTTTVSNFTIQGGTADDPAVLYVKGVPLFLFGNIEYNQQDATGNIEDDDYTKTLIPGISVPDAARIDTVYVDVYLAEVSSEVGSEYQDTTIKDAVLALQTANRLRIVQDILVNETSIPVDGLDTNGIYHRYYKLAEIDRHVGNANILTADIRDSLTLFVSPTWAINPTWGRSVISSLKEISLTAAGGTGNIRVANAIVENNLAVGGTVTIINTTNTVTDRLTVTSSKPGEVAMLVTKTNNGDALQLNQSAGTGNALSVISGNVGVGTTSAVAEGVTLYQKRLSIQGTSANIILSGEDNSAASLYTTNATPLRFGTNNTSSALFINTSNIVGVNTLTPTNANGEVLDVGGRIRLRTGATAGYVLVSDANGVGLWTNPSAIGDNSKWTMYNGVDLYNTNYTSGRVVIGSTAVQSQKLVVQVATNDGIAVRNSSGIRAKLNIDSTSSGGVTLYNFDASCEGDLSCYSSDPGWVSGGIHGSLDPTGMTVLHSSHNMLLTTEGDRSIWITPGATSVPALRIRQNAIIVDSDDLTDSECIQAEIVVAATSGFLFKGVTNYSTVFSVDYSGSIIADKAEINTGVAINTPYSGYYLDVNGQSRFTGSASATLIQADNSGIVFDATNSANGATIVANSSSSTSATCVRANIQVAATSGYLFEGITNGSTVFSVNYAGDVVITGTLALSNVTVDSIAVNTPYSGYYLDVNGQSRFSGSISSTLIQADNSNYGTTLQVGNSSTGASIVATSSSSTNAMCVQANIQTAATNGYLFYGIMNGTPRFSVDRLGNVFSNNTISCTSLSSNSVGAAYGNFSGSSTSSIISATNTYASAFYAPTIRAISNNPTNADCFEAYISVAASSGYLFQGKVLAAQRFYVSALGDIYAAGNIAAGTAVSGYRLDINGLTRFSGSASSVLIEANNVSIGTTMQVGNSSDGATVVANSSSSTNAMCVQANIQTTATSGYLFQGTTDGYAVFNVDYTGNVEVVAGTVAIGIAIDTASALHAFRTGAGSSHYNCIVGDVGTSAGNCFTGMFSGSTVFRVDGSGQIYSSAGTSIYMPADLAEWTKVQGDLSEYEVGTIVMQSQDIDLTVDVASSINSVYGVVTDRAAFVGSLTGISEQERESLKDMNDCEIEYAFNAKKIAMVGHIVVKVKGDISRGQKLVLSDVPGVAKAAQTDVEKMTSFAIARQPYSSNDIGLIEVRLL